ncbi:PilZ domain-containing protein [Roseibium hamelinense]|uniref:PilZ domain-containing protein n=1 Tax=Roseibium hamelinense TaxID=150831 RepID=A0A562THI1_9HYPH|nr:PilZ domain-containing protein [Roseibium hamelinense]MTI45726.1 PilZ domain-containing protein [Roseibium hamelinense]TWI93091.1 PilZ domain-containing protein [Roseibium hamelinense]
MLTVPHRRCMIEDISAGGCRIAAKTQGLAEGQQVIVEVPARKLRFHGEIRWHNGEEAGIEFYFMD